MQYTDNYNLKKPDPVTDFYDRQDDNENMDALDAALKDHEDRLTEKEVPETTPFTTSASIGSFPVGSLDGPVDKFEGKGLSLVNSVVNGDFSDGTNGWVSSNSLNAVSNNIISITGNGGSAEPACASNHSINDVSFKTGEKWFIYSKARVTNDVCQRIRFRSSAGLLESNINNPVQNQWYEMYYLGTINTDVTVDVAQWSHLYPDAATANGKVLEVDGKAGVFAINMTALGIEHYTEAQMLDLVRGGYFDGLDSVRNLAVESVGKNLFDKTDVQVNTLVRGSTGAVSTNEAYNTTNFRRVKANQNYVYRQLAGYFHISWYDAQKNFITGYVASANTERLLTSPSNARYIRVSAQNESINPDNLDNAQLEEGTTATAYEPYQSSRLTADVPLRSLPNGVADRVYESDGQMWLEKNVEEYVLQTGDVTTISGVVGSAKIAYVPIGKLAGALGWLDEVDGRLIMDIKREVALGTTWTPDIFITRANGTLEIGVPSDTVDLAAAQTDLAGTKIHYQLATPELINLTEQGLTSGQLDSFENGTVYQSSDTFHSPELSFDVPSNQGAQISALLDSSNAQAKQIAAKANKVQEDWIEPTLLNGWENFGSPYADAGYYKDDMGVVHLRGFIKNGTTTSGTVIFSLPSGYRPTKNYRGTTTGNGAYASVEVGSDGQVVCRLVSSAWTSLDGISFRAEV